MAKTKEIQRRIKSIGNTKKITRAMEMVAASKMKKAVESVLRTRTYANLSWTTILNLSEAVNSGKSLHPLLSGRKEIKRVGIVLLTSNRGLCGGFNATIMNKAVDSAKKHKENEKGEKIENEFILVGKKGHSVYSRFGYKIAAVFEKHDTCSEVREVSPLARLVIDDFLSGKYDKIMVAYSDFVSATRQVPRVKQLLPVEIEAEEEFLGVVGEDTRVGVDREYIKGKEDKYLHDEKKNKYVFTYEPTPEEVLNEILPRVLEIQLFQALLESNASEHSARMAAMHQATDAAGDLVDELTLFYNKARQAVITSEIAEISAGANALKG
ncbi:MAG: ATP synthase F1 subunit gamma [Patescibacteria group bacterium]|nr:ATP synthase F1 subunit gamma [Patescibacteria group bacterium]